MKNFFGKAQQFGKSFMLPIAILPAAGLLLGIGGALSNPNTISSYPILDQSFLQALFTIMSSAGSIVFANLPVIFAVGIAIGLARSDKGTAALAALVGYLVMNATINAILIITDSLAVDNLSAVGQGTALGIQTLEMGVFGGIVVGIMAGMLHNRFNKNRATSVFRILRRLTFHTYCDCIFIHHSWSNPVLRMATVPKPDF